MLELDTFWINELIKTFVRRPEGKKRVGELDIEGAVTLRNVDIMCDCVS